MEYSINKLAKMSGVSTRTLRYYDEIGLLKPVRCSSSGYRIYGSTQVSDLQQILFYRELDFTLEEIKKLLCSPDYDVSRAFENHLSTLCEKRGRLDALINNLTKSIAAMRSEIEMSDSEKFEGFKQKLIDENEQNYGTEIREKYGEDAVEKSNARIKGLSKAQYDQSVRLSLEFDQTLKAALQTGDPAGEVAQRACELHKRWLCIFYPGYSREYHIGLGELYVSDERFKAYYEKIVAGGAEFLRDAINVYCAE